jgi:hypothetical protein
MWNEAVVLLGCRDRKVTKDHEVVIAGLQGFPSAKQECYLLDSESGKSYGVGHVTQSKGKVKLSLCLTN